MENIEMLKQELITQKEIIESLDGVVKVENSNPSPFEITEGIRSIPSPDLSGSTATEADVVQGKTFYSGSAFLRTGTLVAGLTSMNDIFMPTPGVVTTEDQLYYTIPEEITNVRAYLFYQNKNKIELTFNPNITEICDYAFNGTSNFVFKDFDKMTGLTKIGQYSFENSSCEGIPSTQLPDTVKSIGAYAFHNVRIDSYDYILPEGLSSMGESSFRQDVRYQASSLDVTKTSLVILQKYCFANIAFECDFIPASTIKTLYHYVNFQGCFKNVTIPSTVTYLGDYVFGSLSTDPVSNYYLETATFESVTPPSIGSYIFALQNLENGLKIYVPDEAVEDYKALVVLKAYKDYIYPISEKE